jgi:CRISPR-associated endoribonuclease Cas6
MTLDHELMLYSTVVKLIAMQDGSVPATQGRLAHAAFLDIIRAVDPDLAAALHASRGRKPFTVSPLYGLPRPQEGQVAVRRGRMAWLRFTLLGGELFATFTRRFLTTPSPTLATFPPLAGRRARGHLVPLQGGGGKEDTLKGETNLETFQPSNRPRGGGPTIRMGTLDFAVSEVLTTPGSHAWAGYTPLSALERTWGERRLDAAARNIGLRFASPTVFSRGTRDGLGKWMEPFPSPALLFGSLAAAWNQVSPRPVDKSAVRAYAEETVVVGLYHMSSRMVRYWGQPQIGAVGRVSYLLKDRRDQGMIRTLNCLADFAFYSGVGYKTTMGMGQARREG